MRLENLWRKETNNWRAKTRILVPLANTLSGGFVAMLFKEKIPGTVGGHEVTRMLVRSVVAASLLAMSAPARAEMTVGQVLDGSDVSRLFLHGITDGITWANTALINRDPLFCEPAKLGLTADQEFNILKQFMKTHSEHMDAPAGLMMLLALREVFPCK
jgi:hypothetical protein